MVASDPPLLAGIPDWCSYVGLVARRPERSACDAMNQASAGQAPRAAGSLRIGSGDGPRGS